MPCPGYAIRRYFHTPTEPRRGEAGRGGAMRGDARRRNRLFTASRTSTVNRGPCPPCYFVSVPFDYSSFALKTGNIAKQGCKHACPALPSPLLAPLLERTALALLALHSGIKGYKGLLCVTRILKIRHVSSKGLHRIRFILAN